MCRTVEIFLFVLILALAAAAGYAALVLAGLADAEAWAAVGAPGAERQIQVDAARGYLRRLETWDQVSGGGTADRLGDSWFVANSKIRIARALVELGLVEEAQPILDRAIRTLRVQLGEKNRDYQAALQLRSRMESATD